MYLWYISDWFFVARLDMDREIPLVKETELDDFLSHIGAANEEIRFKNIQKKLLAELKKDIHIFCSINLIFWEQWTKFTNSEACQNLMDHLKKKRKH